MKKITITILSLVMMIGLTSCGETHTVSKTVTNGSTEVHVEEWTYKNDETLSKHKSYVVTYDTPEEAWAAVYGK